MYKLIDKLAQNGCLSREEYITLFQNTDPSALAYLNEKAREKRHAVYGRAVYFRGLIEISNICKNDCYYCGIRASNKALERYRLSPDDIMECCREGYALGFRTFVLQGGEDGYYSDGVLVPLIENIKRAFSDVAVTLSLGERTRESYAALKKAGADRYLLRHESICREHYGKLHPETMSYERRMECLRDLRACGYQVGCGFMVGSPYQTTEMIADEMKFVESFRPDMYGVGPFIPHKDTPFGSFSAGSVETTLAVLSVVRLIHPTVLLPATTALASLGEDGRKRGILAGANVVMPNLSPVHLRDKYALYNNKISSGNESAEQLANLDALLGTFGYHLESSRGDRKETL